MKKLIVSSQQLKEIPNKFNPVWYANKLLLEAEFKEGKTAYVKYSRGKLSITVTDRKLDKKIKDNG
jgi:hypothetical protein